MPEEFRNAFLYVAFNAVVDLFPSSLDDEVDEIGVSGDLSLFASVNGIVITLDSHQRFGLTMVKRLDMLRLPLPLDVSELAFLLNLAASFLAVVLNALALSPWV